MDMVIILPKKEDCKSDRNKETTELSISRLSDVIGVGKEGTRALIGATF